MSSNLPINLDDLLHCRGVESQRIVFKASWESESCGYEVLRTICAFANDHHHLNGGYIIIGVADQNNVAVLPPAGLSHQQLEEAQQWIRKNCNQLNPIYSPILALEKIEGRNVLVVWAPASDMRPHQAPDSANGALCYWIRENALTVDVESCTKNVKAQFEQTVRVPWDDLACMNARVEDISEAMARNFLSQIRSDLAKEPDTVKVYRRMRITNRINGQEVPRNMGLLFFSSDPLKWFPSAKIEVVLFATERVGEIQKVKKFSGGLADQLRDCLKFLENYTTRHSQKKDHHSLVRTWVSYPFAAIRESLVNAVYHRSYDIVQVEPTKVYIYPDKIEIVSYPGPLPGIEQNHLIPGAETVSLPVRNRRIGEYLKQLGLAEEHRAGLPGVFKAMLDNGSPPPVFEFDEQRTYFRVTLPAHPEFQEIVALRDVAHLRSLGAHDDAYRRIESAWSANQASTVLASEMIMAFAEHHELSRAEEVLRIFEVSGPEKSVPYIVNSLAEVLIASNGENEKRKALELLNSKRSVSHGQDAVDGGFLARRACDPELAHSYFLQAEESVFSDALALFEFAQTKIQLSAIDHGESDSDSSLQLLKEAKTLLEKVIDREATPTRHAWTWLELARILDRLDAPKGDIEEAYGKAIAIQPKESHFVEELEKFRGKS
ncbi:MAG: putative DNA binding domain-containing protein [Gammaproteobacteria bacterium]|nr:putative DNA binding domain-containing protein [Gammaproteobacteria bacterium]